MLNISGPLAISMALAVIVLGALTFEANASDGVVCQNQKTGNTYIRHGGCRMGERRLRG